MTGTTMPNGDRDRPSDREPALDPNYRPTEDESIMARWEFGRELLERREGKQC